MLISFWIDVPGAPYPPKIGKNMIFFCLKSWFFTQNTPNIFNPPSARRNFFKFAPLTWNPGSAPDIDLNMYIINVIADDESKIGLYEIYFLND